MTEEQPQGDRRLDIVLAQLAEMRAAQRSLGTVLEGLGEALMTIADGIDMLVELAAGDSDDPPEELRSLDGTLEGRERDPLEGL